MTQSTVMESNFLPTNEPPQSLASLVTNGIGLVSGANIGCRENMRSLGVVGTSPAGREPKTFDLSASSSPVTGGSGASASVEPSLQKLPLTTVTVTTGGNLHGGFGIQDFNSCIQSYSNNDTTISQLIVTPTNSSFESLWEARVNNLKFIQPTTPRPSIIATPTDETQVQTILLCTKKLGYELRTRSGGHDYKGLSYTAQAPFVMLDLVNMRQIDLNVNSRTAWVQSGALLGELYYAISQKTNTLYFPAGMCITVGIGGYLSGGGYGNLVRKYGLAADHALDIRFLDVNGNILDRKSMGEDLFWALRGGGGGSFGIILAWKVGLVPVPEIVTVFRKNVTLEQNGTDIFHKYQYVAPRLDHNLTMRVQIFSELIGNTTTKTIRMLFEGLYLGRMDTLLSLLDKRFPELNITRVLRGDDHGPVVSRVRIAFVHEHNPNCDARESNRYSKALEQ
ncbi:hypothetical protein E3N88_45430 [Mikania micrantha]|uniref:FAD-binding PCMH-type domain-containing protein n=1 Tax=Mikania micrantha TaxID=192012 RepID=A0A5N6L968_9ASTR|nr:hypothetical protein E3N88_45430 [Mikania micrantha]